LVETRHHIDIGTIEASEQQPMRRRIEGVTGVENTRHLAHPGPFKDRIGRFLGRVHPFALLT
jgi:hypothetical protein